MCEDDADRMMSDNDNEKKSKPQLREEAAIGDSSGPVTKLKKNLKKDAMHVGNRSPLCCHIM